MQNNNPFKSIGIVGLGLIGGSLSKAFNNIGISIYGYDNNVDTIKECGISGIFESVTDEFDVFIKYPIDLIYICLPINASLSFIEKLGKLNIKTPITDAGSTKVTTINTAKKYNLNFCGGHPIKGKECSGFANSEEDLFKNAKHLLIPANEDTTFINNLVALHKDIGMNVAIMGGEDHDTVFGLISHFPHLGAFSLIDMVQNGCPDAFEYIGGGFKDFTRIAASDPIMWADIFIDNKKSMLNWIDNYIDTILKWRKIIDNGDYNELKEKILKVSDLRRTL